MIHATFTLRTLTPLFLAGADQTRAELRAPAFRGLMRYWYRALVGGLVTANAGTVEQVMQAETALFGATDVGSAISIKVCEASNDPQQFRKESSRANISGKDYLLWSMATSGRNRLFFPQNTTFRVTLSNKDNDDTKLQQAIAALWLLTHLGGIGSRSRRCAGSVTAQVAEGSVGDFSFDIPGDAEDLRDQISNGIKLAQKLAKRSLHNSTSPSVTQTSFDVLSPKVCRIWILLNSDQTWQTPDAAMRSIGHSLQAYRNDLAIYSRAVFGLPLIGVDNQSRRASPLLLRIMELQRGRYAGIAVLFKTGNNQNYTLIENWANSFSAKIEVQL